MQHPSSFSPRPGAKIKSIAARSVVDGALEDSTDGTFDTSDFWYKPLRLAKNEDVTGLELKQSFQICRLFPSLDLLFGWLLFSMPFHAQRIGHVLF